MNELILSETNNKNVLTKNEVLENNLLLINNNNQKNLVKKCLLNIPVELHRKLKKDCVENDLKVSEFILLAIEEKINK